MSGRHDGRVAVVTGGANGIGRAFALRLATEGATVAILDRADVVARIEGDAAFITGQTFFADGGLVRS